MWPAETECGGGVRPSLRLAGGGGGAAETECGRGCGRV